MIFLDVGCVVSGSSPTAPPALGRFRLAHLSLDGREVKEVAVEPAFEVLLGSASGRAAAGVSIYTSPRKPDNILLPSSLRIKGARPLRSRSSDWSSNANEPSSTNSDNFKESFTDLILFICPSCVGFTQTLLLPPSLFAIHST